MLRKNALHVGLFLILLFIAAPTVFSQDGGDIAPPRVIESNPLSGEELALASPVSLTFDRQMDAENTANQFTIEPEIAGGSWAWDGRTLTFTPPADGYERDTEYQFTVFASDADGQTMADPFTLRLQTVGYLEVTEVLPTPDAESIEVDSAITVIFNRPVVPLVSFSDQTALPDPLQISPDTPGHGEWLNTSIYIFQPDTVLIGGINYTVTVQSGLESVNGAILADDFTFGFATATPVVERMLPRDGDRAVALDADITVTFTQPMDPATQEGIRIEGPGGTAPIMQYTWLDNNRTVILSHGQLLELDVLYDVIVDSSIVRSASGAALTSDYLQSFQTVPYPRIVRTDPSDGASAAPPFGGLRIIFSAPIDEETLEDKIVVDPEPWREYETYYYTYDSSYALYFDSEPSTTYTITIAPGIADPLRQHHRGRNGHHLYHRPLWARSGHERPGIRGSLQCV